MNASPLDPIRIRAATESDTPAVLALFARHLAALGVAPDPELDSDMVDFPASYAGSGRFVVAIHPDHGLVGMAGLRGGEIRRLFVGDPWRGRGLGRWLIADLLRAGPWSNDGRMVAVVARDNQASRRVFEACGFVCTDRPPPSPQMRDCVIYECRRSHTPNHDPTTRAVV